MSGHMNAGATTNMTGIAMIQKLGNDSHNRRDEWEMNDVHNVGMPVMDRPHVVEVHALK
jgi:hypothetical protein